MGEQTHDAGGKRVVRVKDATNERGAPNLGQMWRHIWNFHNPHNVTPEQLGISVQGDPDQNLWASISADIGSTTADTTTDTLYLQGTGLMQVSITGDTVSLIAETRALAEETYIGVYDYLPFWDITAPAGDKKISRLNLAKWIIPHTGMAEASSDADIGQYDEFLLRGSDGLGDFRSDLRWVVDWIENNNLYFFSNAGAGLTSSTFTVNVVGGTGSGMTINNDNIQLDVYNLGTDSSIDNTDLIPFAVSLGGQTRNISFSNFKTAIGTLGDPDQNLWEKVAANYGVTTANSITDLLILQGTGLISCDITGDQVTITTTALSPNSNTWGSELTGQKTTLDDIDAFIIEDFGGAGEKKYIQFTDLGKELVAGTNDGLVSSSGVISLDISTLTADTAIGDTDVMTIDDGTTKKITWSDVKGQLTTDGFGTGDPDQNLWEKVSANYGTTTASSPTDHLILQGTGLISCDITGDQVTITTNAMSKLVNTWQTEFAEDTTPGTSDLFLREDTGEGGVKQYITWLDMLTAISSSTDQFLFYNVASDSGTATADSTADTLTLAGGTGISTAVSGDTLTITNDAPNVAYDIFKTIVTDSGSAIASGTADSVTVQGGTGISTSETGNVITITNDSPNADQNLWLTVAGDTGSTAANITTDTLTIAGGSGITTAMSGDTLTITGSGAPDQNLWERVSANYGTTIANSTTDHLILQGTGLISCDITGDQVTITTTATGDQNLYADVDTDSGTATATTPTDTLEILGGTGISTAASGDVVTITNDSPNSDQNLWHTISANTGSTTPNTTTDTLNINGGVQSGVDTSISGDTVTIVLDLNELDTITSISGGDLFPLYASGNKNITWSNIKTQLSGDGFLSNAGNGLWNDGGIVHVGAGTGSGIAISADNIGLDINLLTTETSIGGTDFVPFWDISGTPDNKKITKANFVESIDGTGLVATSGLLDVSILNLPTDTVINDSDYVGMDDGGATAKKITFANFKSSLPAFGDPDQNLWLTVAGDTGSTAANITTDTLTIAGGTDITTAMSGDTLTITSTASGQPDQNLWEKVSANYGTTTANTTTDHLILQGTGLISCDITGDQVTITTTATNNVGTVTDVTGGAGIASSGGATPNISLTADELAEKSGAVVGTDRLIGVTSTTNWAETISGIPLSIFNNDSGWTSNTGTVTSVTGGKGVDSTGGTTPDLTVDLSELDDMTADVDGSQDELILLDNSADRRKLISEIKLSEFNNDSGWTSNTDQNLWEKVHADTGTATANTTTDQLIIQGTGLISTHISGDNLTIQSDGMSVLDNTWTTEFGAGQTGVSSDGVWLLIEDDGNGAAKYRILLDEMMGSVSHTLLNDVGSHTHTQISTHITTTSGNPHSVSKTNVGLSNVINELQVSSVANTWQSDYSDLGTSYSSELIWFVVEDSDQGGAKYRMNIEEINHDQLYNADVNDHVDHTTVSMVAGTGLIGGGTIQASRTFGLDISNLVTDTAVSGTDTMVIDDGQTKQVTVNTFGTDLIKNVTQAMTVGLSATDEFLVSDNGTGKRMDVSVLEEYIKTNSDWKHSCRFTNLIDLNDAIYDSTGGAGESGEFTNIDLTNTSEWDLNGKTVQVDDRLLVRGQSAQEVTDIHTIPRDNITNGDHFWLFSQGTSHYFWFDVDTFGVDPKVTPPVGSPSTVIAHEIAIDSSTSADAVASVLTGIIDGDADFTASVGTSNITVTNVLSELTKDAVDGDHRSLFTLTTTSQGSDSPVAEISTVQTLAKASIQNQDFFWMFNINESHYFWFDVDTLASDPNPSVPSGAPTSKFGHEVAIDGDTTAAQVADTLRNVIDALPEFSAPNPPSDTITVTHATAGWVRNLEDGTNATGFTLNVTTPGTGNEVTTIDCLAKTNIQNGDHFWLYTAGTSNMFWFDVDTNGVQPQVDVPVGAPATAVYHEVAIDGDTTASDVASTVNGVIDPLGAFISFVSGVQVTVYNIIAEAVRDGGDGETTLTDFTFATTTQGVDGRVNGIYKVTTAGTDGVIERADDQDGDPATNVSAGNFTTVEQGATYANTGWLLEGDGQLTLNTDDMIWKEMGIGYFYGVSGDEHIKTDNLLSIMQQSDTYADGLRLYANYDPSQYWSFVQGSDSRLFIGKQSATRVILDDAAGKQSITIASSTDCGITFDHSANDTNIYRSSANNLSTDDKFNVSFDIANPTTTSYGITFGGTTARTPDTQIYRSAANVLRTPDSFIIDGTTQADGLLVNLNVLKPTITMSDPAGNTNVTIDVDIEKFDNASTGYGPFVIHWWISRWSIGSTDARAYTMDGSPTITLTDNCTNLNPMSITTVADTGIIQTGLTRTVSGNDRFGINITNSFNAGGNTYYFHCEVQGKVYSTAAFTVHTSAV
jgi:hypothetical protein